MQARAPLLQKANRPLCSQPRRPALRPAASNIVAASASDAGAPTKKFMGIEAITWQKIVPLGFMFFCILFNYTILRDTKVSLAQMAHFNSFDLVLFLPLRHPMGPATSHLTGKTARNKTEADVCLFPCAGCACGDSARQWSRNHSLLENMGQLAHGYWLHCPVRQGAALIPIIAPTSLCIERTSHSYPASLWSPTGAGMVQGALLVAAQMLGAWLRDQCALQLANVLSTEQLFYACIFPFIAFFGAFAFIMYPLRDTLHPTGLPLALEVPCDPCSAAVIHLVIQQQDHKAYLLS